MSFGNKPKFKRIEIDAKSSEISEEMAQILVDAWCDVMRKLGYIRSENPTKADIQQATKEADEDGILVLPSKRVYDDDKIIYDIVIQQIGAEIVFERSDAEDNPLQ